ncbi:MAG: hypothetical protein V3T72_17035 [Thermoanaerobaculia bacterium]
MDAITLADRHAEGVGIVAAEVADGQVERCAPLVGAEIEQELPRVGVRTLDRRVLLCSVCSI